MNTTSLKQQTIAEIEAQSASQLKELKVYEDLEYSLDETLSGSVNTEMLGLLSAIAIPTNFTRRMKHALTLAKQVSEAESRMNEFKQCIVEYPGCLYYQVLD